MFPLPTPPPPAPPRPRQGGYMGVRRVVRLLEVGDIAKRAADAAIDANGQLLNLRTSILK